MHGKQAKRCSSNAKVNDDRTPGLEPWQFQLTDMVDDTVAIQHDIAVPSVTSGVALRAENRPVTSPQMQIVQVKESFSFTKSRVCFLQYYDVCIQFKDHVFDSQRIKYAVISNAFMNVVRRDGQFAGYRPPLGSAHDANLATFQLSEPRNYSCDQVLNP